MNVTYFGNCEFLSSLDSDLRLVGLWLDCLLSLSPLYEHVGQGEVTYFGNCEFLSSLDSDLRLVGILAGLSSFTLATL